MATSEPVARTGGHLEPRDVGQAEVEDDDLDPGRRVGDVEAVATGRSGLDDVAVFLEQSREQANQPWVVFDDEEVHVGQPTPSVRGRQ